MKTPPTVPVLDRTVGWFAMRSLRREREPIGRGDMITLGVLAAALWGSAVIGDVAGGALGSVLSLVPYGMAGASLLWLAGIARKKTWERGYRSGRQSVFTSLYEARQRGLSSSEWLTAELERDLGQFPVEPDPEP